MPTASRPLTLRTFDSGRLTLVLLGSFLTPLLLGLPLFFLPDFALGYHAGLWVVFGVLGVLLAGVGVGIWWSIRRVELHLSPSTLILTYPARPGAPLLSASRTAVQTAAVTKVPDKEQYRLHLQVAGQPPLELVLLEKGARRTELHAQLQAWLAT